MTTPGTPKTFKNTEKHEKMLFEFGGRFLASRSGMEASPGEGLAAEVGLSGGGGGFASQLCILDIFKSDGKSSKNSEMSSLVCLEGGKGKQQG